MVKFGKTIRIQTLSVLLLMALSSSMAGALNNTVVAMVADIQGQVMIEVDGEMQPCEILSELDAGSKLRIESDSALTLFYFDSSEEFTYDMAGEIMIGTEQPEAVTGGQASSRNLNMETLAEIAMEDDSGIAIGLLKLRSGMGPQLRLISPRDTKVLESNPEFHWTAIEGAQSYQFILSSELGKTIAAIQVAGTSLTLPADVTLGDGADYTWEIVAKDSDTEYRAHAYFSLVEPDLRTHIESAQPTAQASFAERVVFARMLERLEVKEAATKIWQELALLRPELKPIQKRVAGSGEN